jgi:phage terminase large subunit GpA-like protein
MREFAESEIIIPDGPFKGEPFDCSTQPFSRLFFDEVDSGRWARIAATGPTQTGKSLICYAIPICYHLFAAGETVVVGVPDMRMAQDKWQEDLDPVIQAAPRFRAQMPAHGEGSKGGSVKSRIKFRHGPTLRFMSGGGSDKARAGFTTRVLAVTEVDGLDEAGDTSREADKLKQMEGRTRAFGMLGKRVYLECTVSIEHGRIWQEWQNGTASRIALPCLLCDAWVTPEREHLKGWQDAESEWEAHDKARWTCPECGEPWTEQQRAESNTLGVLAHAGQEVTPDGEVVGEPPRVMTLGFRWTAINNLFASAGEVGVEEWRAARSADLENAERELCQFVHCLPYEDPDIDTERLDFDKLTKHATRKKGIVPRDTSAISVGIDTSKRRLDWVADAWRPDGSGQVIEYGEHPVDWERLGVTEGLKAALTELAAYFHWPVEGGGEMTPLQVWIDSGYPDHREGVYSFCREINERLGCKPGREIYRPAKGYGERQRQMQRFRAPKKKTQETRYLGRDYYMTKVQGSGVLLVHVNADVWKSEFHRALAKEPGEPGALVLYEGPPEEHRGFFDQITAEERREIHEEGRGTIVYWHTLRRNNHKLDAGYLAQAAGHFAIATQAAKKGPGEWWTGRKKQRRR